MNNRSNEELLKEIAILREELEKQNHNKRFEYYFENNKTPMLLIDGKTKAILDVNEAAIKFYGYSKKEFTKLTGYDINMLSIDEVDSKFGKAIKSSSNKLQLQHKLANSEIRDVEVYATPMQIDNQLRMVISVFDITEKMELENSLKDSREILNLILYHSPDAILLFKGNKLKSISGAFFNKLGYHEDFFKNATKETFINLIHPRDKFKIVKKMSEEIQNQSEISRHQYRMTTADNKYIWVDHVAKRSYDENGYPDLTIIISRDITEQVKAQKKLEKREKKLKESNATKDKFFSIIAHDLKNPFNSMLGFSNILLQKYDQLEDDKKKMYLKTVHQGLEYSYALLENLLLWTRAQRGIIEMNIEQVNLHKVVEETFTLFTIQAKNKSIHLQNRLAHNLIVKADKNMITTVIRNLISNAIKFSNTNGKVAVTSKDKSENKIEIIVWDKGIGIPAKKQEKLFKIASNSSSLGTDGEKGSGLGLFICHEFIKRHGEKLWVKSKEIHGTEFGFALEKAAD